MCAVEADWEEGNDVIDIGIGHTGFVLVEGE